MALSTEAEKREAPKPRLPFEALVLRTPEGWHGYLVPLLPLPISAQQKPQYVDTLHRLTDSLRLSAANERTVFLELEELHKEDVIRQIAANGSTWGPEFGLGVRPELPPPAFWKFEELIERRYDEPIPPLMLSVVRLEAEEAGSTHAVSTMAGTGGLLQCIHRGPIADLVAEWMEVLLPPIQEEGLKAFPLYVPLLTAASLAGTTQQLDMWLGSVNVYLRESPQDKGLLILSRQPLEKKLLAAGIDVPLPLDHKQQHPVNGASHA